MGAENAPGKIHSQTIGGHKRVREITNSQIRGGQIGGQENEVSRGATIQLSQRGLIFVVNMLGKKCKWVRHEGGKP